MSVRSRGIVLALLIAALAPAISAEPEFLIVIKNHQFIPAELRIPAGVKVQIVVDNQDDAPEEFESYSLNREKHIPPKAKVTLFLGPLDPGRYPFEGESHGVAGMAQGIVIVK